MLSASGSNYGKADATDGVTKISTSMMPSHTHSGPEHTHSVSGSVAAAGSHSHYIDVVDNNQNVQSTGQNFQRTNATSGSSQYYLHYGGGAGYWLKAASAGSHSHTFSVTSGKAGTGSTGAAGGSSSFIPHHYSVNV